MAPGRFLILPNAGRGYHPVSVRLNGQEVIGKSVDLFPGSTIRVSHNAANGSLHRGLDNCNGGVVLSPKAKYLGMKQVKGLTSQGQPVFEKGGRYFTFSRTSHTAGEVFKELDRSGERIATTDLNLNRIGP
jgi:hypothetical protein